MKPKFDHIIILMLENRSFDHLFGFLDHPKKFNGLNGTESNPISATNATKVNVYKTDKTSISPDPPHSHEEIMKQLDLGVGNKNDGFVAMFDAKKAAQGGTSNRKEIMSVIDPTTPKKCGFIMAEIAKRFVLCDNWYSSVPGETWPNRNFAHAATSDGEVNITKKFYGNKTIYQVLAQNNLTWNIYHDGPPQSWVFYKLWFTKKGGFRDFDNFEQDVKEDKLANFIFIEPRHFALGKQTNNMHPGNNSSDSDKDFKSAENLVAYVYKLLNTNKKVFDKTLLLITFDEHGGYYDHVTPPACTPPDKKTTNDFKFDQYGIRVPAIIVSPFVKKSTIDSTEYDHSSIAKSVFENFGIAKNLTARDKAANNFIDRNLVATKKTNLAPMNEHKIISARAKSKAITTEENIVYNDFQKDLIELSQNVERVMGDTLKEVEANIKALETSTKTKGKKSSAKVDVKKIESKFLAKYGDKR
jgi:phospholipase C